MGRKMKMIVGIALVLSVVSMGFLAAPIQAYVNRTANRDLLQTQDRDRLRTQDCDSLQMQDRDRDRLRTQNCDCTCDCTQTQYRSRQRTNECATNRICNCTMNLEQHSYQYRERTRSLQLWWTSIKEKFTPLFFLESQSESTKSVLAPSLNSVAFK